jgi:galactokinase-like galactose-binding protein
MISLEDVRRRFSALFGGTPRVFRAPGRVNLIGEHVDYNEGWVLPLAIDRSCYVAARLRNDQVLRVYSEQMQESPGHRSIIGATISAAWRGCCAKQAKEFPAQICTFPPKFHWGRGSALRRRSKWRPRLHSCASTISRWTEFSLRGYASVRRTSTSGCAAASWIN